jgi:hypothetical protein
MEYFSTILESLRPQPGGKVPIRFSHRFPQCIREPPIRRRNPPRNNARISRHPVPGYTVSMSPKLFEWHRAQRIAISRHLVEDADFLSAIKTRLPQNFPGKRAFPESTETLTALLFSSRPDPAISYWRRDPLNKKVYP